ncbi:hypothetical protein GDO81_000869 [Engystomops pustulosus]|uniref:Uncharacterized protein n=1 Tax=Engystomops pustulosus TaxID=76066 RepID=A0AAV7D7X7_ENGPU|nr:hypothetical protein GDO81_000869 [Engystomops pustulosus]
MILKGKNTAHALPKAGVQVLKEDYIVLCWSGYYRSCNSADRAVFKTYCISQMSIFFIRMSVCLNMQTIKNHLICWATCYAAKILCKEQLCCRHIDRLLL